MRFASASGMRGNGRVGTSRVMPNSASISSPCFCLTAVMPATISSSCSCITSSCEEIQLISLSIDVNSVACREVNDGSARNAGPTSNTLPNPAGCAICLKNCGLCARYAVVSK